MIKLRPAQQKIAAYENGRLAISAVPGSGKTFTLTYLAAKLIGNGRIDRHSQQILIVTYLNASVDTFKARIRQRLGELGLPTDSGFDVRTLHSLAHEIVHIADGGIGTEGSETAVLSDGGKQHALSNALIQWIDHYPDEWNSLLPNNSPKAEVEWRRIVERMAASFISSAKNERIRPEMIMAKLEKQGERADGLLWMAAGIYGRYQHILNQQGARDFDDLIWHATDLLEQRPHLADSLRQRWPYILEDEAQDSVPLQEALIQALIGENGEQNWVRVGDPNQAITSSFTAADPAFFNAFATRPDVRSLPLPNSGRSAPLIIGAANALVDWVCDHHPIEEVHRHTFRRQYILPVTADDGRPNPPDSEAGIHIQVYDRREEDELPRVARLARLYAEKFPDRTLAILVPINRTGHDLADYLDKAETDYDNLLNGNGREREIAAALHAMLALLADPISSKTLPVAFAALHALDHPAAACEQPDKIILLLSSVRHVEKLLFPKNDAGGMDALPTGRTTETDAACVQLFTHFLQILFALRPLPINDLMLALGDALFTQGDKTNEADLSLAYQIGSIMRQWRDANPEWRLPELAAELKNVADGRRSLPIPSPTDAGYEPAPGRITLATQHKSKGLEWDAVFLVGIDGGWIPSSLDAYFQGTYAHLGGDPTAEVKAALYELMGNTGGHAGRTPTESAHINVISERLRLFYVGITRAKRFLHISRSKSTRRYRTERPSEPTSALGALYRYLKDRGQR